MVLGLPLSNKVWGKARIFMEIEKTVKTEAEKKEEFLEAYRELVRKHGYDFFQQPPAIVKVEFIKDIEEKK